MTATKQTVLVKDFGPALTEALERLVKKHEEIHPFVVVEHKPTGRFLQFAGSAQRNLMFDVPQLGIVLRPMMSVRHGVEEAEGLVRSVSGWGLSGDEAVVLTEDEDWEGLRRRLTRQAKEWYDGFMDKVRELAPARSATVVR